MDERDSSNSTMRGRPRKQAVPDSLAQQPTILHAICQRMVNADGNFVVEHMLSTKGAAMIDSACNRKIAIEAIVYECTLASNGNDIEHVISPANFEPYVAPSDTPAE